MATTTDRRRPFRRPGSTALVLATWATFLVIFVVLALQLRAGEDPVLGAPKAAERPVVVKRRVIFTRVVTEPAAAGAATSSAPVTTSSAPVTASAPAPAPAAPAPVAPAPAPVTTQSS